MIFARPAFSRDDGRVGARQRGGRASHFAQLRNADRRRALAYPGWRAKAAASWVAVASSCNQALNALTALTRFLAAGLTT